MEILEPNLRQRKILDRFENVGGVLEYLQLSCPGEVSSRDSHASAVCAAMHEIERRGRATVDQLVASGRVAPERLGSFALAFDCTGLIGTRIGLSQFLGSGFKERLEEEIAYVHAFSAPPYPMQTEQMDVLFAEMSAAFLDDLRADLEIYHWSTDWSDYFKEGREWWGTYLWSVHRPGARQITVILGSATD